HTVFRVRDRDSGIEPAHGDITQQRRTRPFSPHGDTNRATPSRRFDGDIPDRADIVGQIVDADRARIVLTHVDGQILHEILIGVVAFALVRVVLAAAVRGAI